jgi:hypothetical protein
MTKAHSQNPPSRLCPRQQSCRRQNRFSSAADPSYGAYHGCSHADFAPRQRCCQGGEMGRRNIRLIAHENPINANEPPAFTSMRLNRPLRSGDWVELSRALEEAAKHGGTMRRARSNGARRFAATLIPPHPARDPAQQSTLPRFTGSQDFQPLKSSRKRRTRGFTQSQFRGMEISFFRRWTKSPPPFGRYSP